MKYDCSVRLPVSMNLRPAEHKLQWLYTSSAYLLHTCCLTGYELRSAGGEHQECTTEHVINAKDWSPVLAGLFYMTYYILHKLCFCTKINCSRALHYRLIFIRMLYVLPCTDWHKTMMERVNITKCRWNNLRNMPITGSYIAHCAAAQVQESCGSIMPRVVPLWRSIELHLVSVCLRKGVVKVSAAPAPAARPSPSL